MVSSRSVLLGELSSHVPPPPSLWRPARLPLFESLRPPASLWPSQLLAEFISSLISVSLTRRSASLRFGLSIRAAVLPVFSMTSMTPLRESVASCSCAFFAIDLFGKLESLPVSEDLQQLLAGAIPVA